METTVNDRIRELRALLSISQSEFANKVGASIMTVSRWETGHAIPVKNLYRINQVFGVSMEWLQFGTGELILNQNASVEELVENPWKDEAYKNLKEENSFLKDQIQMMREMIQVLKPQANFLNGNAFSGVFATANTGVSVRA